MMSQVKQDACKGARVHTGTTGVSGLNYLAAIRLNCTSIYKLIKELKSVCKNIKRYMTDFFICLIESKWHPDMNIRNNFSITIFLPRAFAV